jgi:transcriptional antiterminator RfaH
MSSTAHWHLIHTKPACEAVAQSHLERQAYEVYWPRLARPVSLRGRCIERIVSLFPRYLFLRLQVGRQALAPVRSTIGVADIVRFGFEYAVVPDTVVDGLRERADSATGLHRLSAPEALKPGAGVRVLAGPFDGLEGIFLRRSGNERVVILLRLMGREAPVRVPASFVSASPLAYSA